MSLYRLVHVSRLGLVPIRFASAAVVKKSAPAAPAPTTETSTEKKASIWDKFGEIYVPSRKIQPMPKDFKEFPERDTVNFPHDVLKMWPNKVRLGFIPDSWFLFFYRKTGVTGPYLFGWGLVTFMLQKEILVLEPGWKHLPPLLILLFFAHKFAGAPLNRWLDSEMNKQLDAKEKWRNDQQDDLKDAIQTEKYLQDCYRSMIPLMYEAKRENVHLQLEASYRDRVHQVYQEVKRRMDYLAESEEAKRRFEQRHMVQWIVDQVKKSITDQFEKNYLNQCIVDLKSLSKSAR